MVDDENNKEVNFRFYCPLCQYEAVDDGDLPCSDCLDTPVRVGTEKPIKFVVKTWFRR